MTKEEFALIVKGMKAIYTEPTFIPDQYAFEMWYSLLKDMDYQTCSLATQRWMSSNSKVPKPADIRDMTVKNAEPEELSEMAAWNLVAKALRNGNYGAQEEFDKLPPLVQKAVGAPSQLRMWAADPEYNESVVSSNFMRSYRACVARSNEDARIPQAIKDLITQTNVKGIEQAAGELQGVV